MATEVTSDPVAIQLDPQDPLPESNWTYRRWFIFICTAVQVIAVAVILTMLYKIAEMLAVAKGIKELLAVAGLLYKIGLWVIALTIVDRVLYMIAPSAEQATKMMQTAKMAIEGVVFRNTQVATTSPDKITGTTSTILGKTNDEPSSARSDTPTDGGVAAAGAGVELRPSGLPDKPPGQR